MKRDDFILLIREKLDEGLRQCRIPEHCHDGLVLYLTKGIPPGSFLCAVLANQLAQSFARADTLNFGTLGRYANLLYNYMPGEAWGSEDAVEAWCERFRTVWREPEPEE